MVVSAEDIRLIADGSYEIAKKKDRNSIENGTHMQDKFNCLIFTHTYSICEQ